MNRIRLSLGILLALTLVLTIMVLCPSRAAAQCAGSWGNGFTGPSELNREGLAERPADFEVTNAGATCFVAGNSIRVTYNALISLPTGGITNASTNYYQVSDPNSTLVLNITTTSGVGNNNQPQTVIEMDVITGTTNVLAYITLQNLRFNVTTIGDGATLNAYLSSTAPPTTPSPTAVGTVRNTIEWAPAPPAVTTVGLGVQSSGGPLATQAVFDFNSNPNWATTSPFRIAVATPPITGDIPTGPTSLTFFVEKIPSGVTVTFPPTLTLPGLPEIQWKAVSSTLSATGGSLAVTYNTVINAGVTSFTLTLDTAATATDLLGLPTIGVQIGSASGNGTATLRVVFGPTVTAQFSGDNTGSLALPPVYTNSIAASLPSRQIIGTSTGSGVNFFTITPTTSVLLFNYATDLEGYGTGIAVANTANDSTIFNTVGQTGTITLYFFDTATGDVVVYTPAAGDGRGLNANGQLPPGGVFAISLDEALGKAGTVGASLVGNFSGYVIAYCQFQYGHGYSLVFNPNGIGTALGGLFLGPALGNAALRFDTLQEGLLQ